MYIELHCHSAFSFLDGASLPEQLALTASQLGLPALALTDHNGLYGSMAFAEQAKSLGLQAITGAELTLLDGSHVTLLAETPEGYANLCRLVTEAHLGRPDRRDPRLDFAALEARHAGLIVLSGCRSGLLPTVLQRDGKSAARRLAERCRTVFGPENFFVELQRNHVRGDRALTATLSDLADATSLGVVATGDVHYHQRARHRLHDVLVAIRHRTTLDGSHHVRRPNSEFHLRPPEEAAALFALARAVAADVRRGSGRAHGSLLPGRGRGSSVSSVVCYLLGLSHVDPVATRLFIGRFLNESLASVPDIDLDFPREIREELIRRVYKRYGDEHVGLVCSFPTYRLRSTVREIGKALDLPLGEIEQVAKLADRRSGGLADELEQLPGFEGREHAPLWKELCELAEEIAGLPRHVSQPVRVG